MPSCCGTRWRANAKVFWRCVWHIESIDGSFEIDDSGFKGTSSGCLLLFKELELILQPVDGAVDEFLEGLNLMANLDKPFCVTLDSCLS